jgi:ornithine decarboxylase
MSVLAKNQINFDCASKGEIKQVLDLGINNNRIIYANPYKSDSDIKYAESKNIPLTVVDSVEEFEKIKHNKMEILIRVKVNDKESLMPFSSKFGSSFEETIDILKLAKLHNKNISGFSFHVGSGCYNPNQYYDAIKMIYDIILKTKDLNHNYKIVDIGGGYSGACDIEFIKQANSINKSLKLFEHPINFMNNIKFISEPGRFFMTKSHTLFVPIIAKRKTNNKIFYIIDESIYSSFSNITYDMGNPKLEIMNEPKNSYKLYDSIIFGRTCDSADKILETTLPELNIGDYFEVKNMGAYTTASSTNFNGFETTEKIYLC